MLDTTEASNLQTPSDASDGAHSRVDQILARYAELGLYAVQLAQQRLSLSATPFLGRIERSCNVCLTVWDPGEIPAHDESCVVGRIFALSVEIARLKAAAAERKIEYLPTTSLLGEFRPARTVTHEQAARSAQGATA